MSAMRTHREEVRERHANRSLHADPPGEARKEQRVKERHALYRDMGATSDAEESDEQEEASVEEVEREDAERPVEEDVEGEEADDAEARERRDRLAREEAEDIE
jgi:hypothetical protein